MKVSVIIPYKKDRGYLREAIRSAKQQSYPVEIILSKSPNRVGYNLNKGIEQSTGDLIVYLCDDDLLPKDSIKMRVEAMKDYDFIHSKGLQFWKNKRTAEWKLTNEVVTLERMVKQNCIMGGTTMYRRELFDEFRFDEDLWTGEEYDFHMNLLKHSKKLGYLDEITYLYRRHNKQKSLGNMRSEYQNKRKEAIKLIRQRYA